MARRRKTVKQSKRKQQKKRRVIAPYGWFGHSTLSQPPVHVISPTSSKEFISDLSRAEFVQSVMPLQAVYTTSTTVPATFTISQPTQNFTQQPTRINTTKQASFATSPPSITTTSTPVAQLPNVTPSRWSSTSSLSSVALNANTETPSPLYGSSEESLSLQNGIKNLTISDKPPLQRAPPVFAKQLPALSRSYTTDALNERLPDNDLKQRLRSASTSFQYIESKPLQQKRRLQSTLSLNDIREDNSSYPTLRSSLSSMYLPRDSGYDSISPPIVRNTYTLPPIQKASKSTYGNALPRIYTGKVRANARPWVP